VTLRPWLSHPDQEGVWAVRAAPADDCLLGAPFIVEVRHTADTWEYRRTGREVWMRVPAPNARYHWRRHSNVDEMQGEGLVPRKFVVKHYRRGDMLDGEAFVLVPGRDPAAVAAIRAYAEATGDNALSLELLEWADDIEPAEHRKHHADAVGVTERVPGWVTILTREVQMGRMTVECALTRIAGHAIHATCQEYGDGLTPEVTEERDNG